MFTLIVTACLNIPLPADVSPCASTNPIVVNNHEECKLRYEIFRHDYVEDIVLQGNLTLDQLNTFYTCFPNGVTS